MARIASFNTELESGDLTIYGTVKSVERVGHSVKLEVFEDDDLHYISEAGTTTVYSGPEADHLRRINGWQ